MIFIILIYFFIFPSFLIEKEEDIILFYFLIEKHEPK